MGGEGLYLTLFFPFLPSHTHTHTRVPTYTQSTDLSNRIIVSFFLFFFHHTQLLFEKNFYFILFLLSKKGGPRERERVSSEEPVLTEETKMKERVCEERLYCT